MTRIGSLYEVCSELFASYPLAASVAACDDAMRSMVLMLSDGENARFFLLSHYGDEDPPFYSLRLWRAASIVSIEAYDDDAAPEIAVEALTQGVPIPRHGSLFGWICEDDITALVTVTAEFTPEYPEPSWAVMPLAKAPAAYWPPFTGEPFFGRWFWKYYQSRHVVSLNELIAETPDTVFWADTKAIVGWDSCAVARDIRSSAGYTLRRGCYVYYQALQAGKPVPSLSRMLTVTDKTDLAPRFRSACPPRRLITQGCGHPR
jgi:hypothetical protein